MEPLKLHELQSADLLRANGIDPSCLTLPQWENFAVQDIDTQIRSIRLYKSNMGVPEFNIAWPQPVTDERIPLKGNALPDYHTELMLFERQNRARLALERQRLANPDDAVDHSEHQNQLLVTIDHTLSRDSTAGSKVEQDSNLAAVFRRHDDSIKDVDGISETDFGDVLEAFNFPRFADMQGRAGTMPESPYAPGRSVTRRMPHEKFTRNFGPTEPSEFVSTKTGADFQDSSEQAMEMRTLSERPGSEMRNTYSRSSSMEMMGRDTNDLKTPDSPTFEEIYAVTCNHTNAHCLLFHDLPTTRTISWVDKPKGTSDNGPRDVFDRTIARGQRAIGGNIARYLERRPSLEVVALWIVECPEVYELRDLERDNLNNSTDHFDLKPRLYLLVISASLRESISACAKFHMPETEILPLSGQLDVPESIRVIDQDQFYFHHREVLLSQVDLRSVMALSRALLLAGQFWDTSCNQAAKLHAEGRVDSWSVRRLFHPNQAVIAWPLETKRKPAVCIVDHVEEKLLHCWMWDFDGYVFQRKAISLAIKVPQDRPIQITDLATYPLDFANYQLVESIRKRAEKMWQLRQQSFMAYSGWDANHDTCYQDARFVVDVATHRRVHASSRISPSQSLRNQTQILPDEIRIAEPMPHGIVLLAMPVLVAGFDLQSKKWISLYVENIKQVQFNKSVFSALVLPKETKELVHALVATQETQDGFGSSNDVIQGKGNGLILLLHGSPGTGKTLTAESVAEIAERPLYRVTCGDIGTDPESVEKYLQTVLYLGKTWNCVVLLDEADVFLEERDLFDLARNSLVSVFLRTLEYYEGILILTSNRVGTFDEAFTSRIQVALHYPDLTRVTRKKIWQNFLDRIEEDESLDADVSEITDHLDELKELEMNGRQIRNAVNTARRLATFKKETLTWSHIKQVVGIVGQFTEYLEKTHKHKDNERAREMGWRR